MLNLKFLFKLLHNLIVCPELLERINFNVNIKKLRNKHPFYLSIGGTPFIMSFFRPNIIK